MDFEDKSVEIPRFNHNLKLAYGITVHKAQGSEADFIIIPIHSSHSPMVTTRNWLYTAITRAKKMCFLVGDWRITNQMIGRQQSNLRQTSLGLHLNWNFNDHNNN